MKRFSRRTAFLALVMSVVALPAVAGDSHVKGDHHSPKYGGVVREVGVVQYELVAKPDAIAIFVEDHGKKVDVSGASAKLTLLNEKEKSEVVLTPAGGNKLEAKGSFKVSGGTRVVAVVALAGKPALSMRFVVPK